MEHRRGRHVRREVVGGLDGEADVPDREGGGRHVAGDALHVERRQHRPRRHQDAHQHDQRRRQDAPDAPGVEGPQVDASVALALAHEEPGDQEPRQDEEDVDPDEAAAHRRQAGVEREDQEDGDATQALEVRAGSRHRRRDPRVPTPAGRRASESRRAHAARRHRCGRRQSLGIGGPVDHRVVGWAPGCWDRTDSGAGPRRDDAREPSSVTRSGLGRVRGCHSLRERSTGRTRDGRGRGWPPGPRCRSGELEEAHREDDVDDHQQRPLEPVRSRRRRR